MSSEEPPARCAPNGIAGRGASAAGVSASRRYASTDTMEASSRGGACVSCLDTPRGYGGGGEGERRCVWGVSRFETALGDMAALLPFRRHPKGFWGLSRIGNTHTCSVYGVNREKASDAFGMADFCHFMPSEPPPPLMTNPRPSQNVNAPRPQARGRRSRCGAFLCFCPRGALSQLAIGRTA